MPTDTSEKGLETTIVDSLVDDARYVRGDSKQYVREYAVDLDKLIAFLTATQPKIFAELDIVDDGPARTQFLSRLQGEIAKRGVVDVLRNGIKHGPANIDLFFGTPSPGNAKATEQYAKNIFSVTRQLRYSTDETQRSLDMVIFINGLPVITFELKNSLTKQTIADAIVQYKKDRPSKELLFQFGRCMVHFAVDDQQVFMCTHLKNGASWFLPFNKGYNDGAGNPPNPAGLATDYLWKIILTKRGLTDIIENFAQIVEEKDKKGRKKRTQIFPRYHQLDVVHEILADVPKSGVGKKYLIQHSAGSGKSNSIAWLAHQLIDVKQGDKPVIDTIIVITDRRILDKQIRDTIKQFTQVSNVVGHAEKSGDLKKFLKEGKRIIISTVQKFPVIYKEIGDEHRNNKFALIIDEAHSSQGGKSTAKMHAALSEQSDADDETIEDKINHIIETKKMLKNASYFAFTATPKNKTLEIFGVAQPPDAEGKIKHRPFHAYTMKQAIQEGFILDVLKNYTPVDSYYLLEKKISDDPLFDANRAMKKLRHYVESHDDAIRKKAEIMVDHFHDHVQAKIKGTARVMIVTSSIARAIQYFRAVEKYLEERKSPWKSIVAFSGEQEIAGKKMTEASFNGFPSKDIPENFQENPYRFLIVADKFQTGYDEPLLHTMYVDKQLSDIKAVQTLSRLNRAHPDKHNCFVLDFVNDAKTITEAFSDYYRTTILSEETDPNKVHDLKAALDGYQVYAWSQVEDVVAKFLTSAPRPQLDAILDVCRIYYVEELDEDAQVAFKGKAKAFCRTYEFLAALLPYNNPEWEKLSIFLNFLIPKLPAPEEDDLSRGVLEAIDMDSYRAEVKQTTSLALPDADAEIEPIPMTGGGGKGEPALDQLSNIVRQFNELWGKVEWKDKDKIRKVITEDIPAKVAANKKYQNAMQHSDKQNARIEHDKALKSVIGALFSDHAELFKQFQDNESFKKWLADTTFGQTYKDAS